MKESEVNNQISQRLMEFESMDVIHPTADWSNSLMERLYSVKPNYSPIISSVKFTIAVLLIFIINIGFVLISIFNDSQQSTLRDKELQIISKELLIYTNSIYK